MNRSSKTGEGEGVRGGGGGGGEGVDMCDPWGVKSSCAYLTVCSPGQGCLFASKVCVGGGGGSLFEGERGKELNSHTRI